MSDYTGNEFKIIANAKQALLDTTNIESSPEEMKVLNDFLFRCWQMGWLDEYDDTKDVVEVVRCKDCKYWRPDTRPEGSLDERADGLWGIGNLCIKHLPSDQLEAIQFSPDDYCKYGERKDDE